jgi:uncharacterized protein YbjT (DUF2867 family)
MPARLALVAGGSGLVGRELLAQIAPRTDLKALALLRKPLAPTMLGIEQQLVDFEKLDTLELPSASVAFSCLGSTAAAAGSPEAFRHIDHELVLAFARAALKAGVTCLVHVSASGASATSRIFYSRVKAETEAALAALGFASLVVLRPSLLLGDRASLNQPKRTTEAISQTLAPLLSPILPLSLRPITAFAVARAMLAYGLAAPAGHQVVSNALLHSRS